MANITTSTNIASAKETIIIDETHITYERANRIAVQSIGTGFKADFYRTHKHIATLLSSETGWTPSEEATNKTAQREEFRRFAIDHASEVGVIWKPQDLRSESNKRIPKYTDDQTLKQDCINMLWDDLWAMNRDCGLGLEFGILSADTITPMTHTAKGADLSKMGITDGKYNSTGNWAWADVEMTLTLSKDGQEIYYTTTCQLVSGQLKKPHITKTAFTESLKESLKEVGLWEEPAKESAKDSKAEPKAEEVQEEVKAESKPKKTRSKKSKQAEVSAQ